FLADRLAARANTATALHAELLERCALDVAALAERDHALLVWDEVLLAEVLRIALHDLRAAGVAILALQFGHVVVDEREDLARVREQVLEIRDALDQLLVLVEQRLALQRGETAELHVEDGPRLDLREVEWVSRPHRDGLV